MNNIKINECNNPTKQINDFEDNSEQNDRRNGIVAVILAGILWGIISIFVRRLNLEGFDSFEIMLFRAGGATILLFIGLLVLRRELLIISVKDIWMFVGTGLLSLTFFSYCYFFTIVECGAAVAVVLLYTSPIFVMLLSAVIFKEQITYIKIAALALTFAGTVLVVGGIGSENGMSIKSLLIGLGAGFGYALYSIFGGFAVKKYSSLTISFYTFLFSTISLFFLTGPTKIATRVATKGTSIILPILGIVIVCTIFPYVLYTYGLNHMEKSRAAVLVTVEPLVGAILGILVYKEDCSIFRLIGILIIFCAILIIVNKKERT